MANESKVDIAIEAKNNSASAFKQVDGQLAGLNQSISGLVKGAGFAALGAGLLQVGKSLFEMSREAQEVGGIQNQLNATLASTGGVAGVTAAQVNALSSQIQGLTNYDAEAAASAQSLLLTFTKIGSDVFPRATKAAVDMSARFDQDLKSSVTQLGKALNDPIEGISALSRIGIQFSDSQRKMVAAMMEVNDVAGAQAIILREVETQVQGSAAAQADSIIQLGNAWGDLREAMGALVLPTIDEQAKGLTGDIAALAGAIGAGASGDWDAAKLIVYQNAIGNVAEEYQRLQDKQANVVEGTMEWFNLQSGMQGQLAYLSILATVYGQPIPVIDDLTTSNRELIEAIKDAGQGTYELAAAQNVLAAGLDSTVMAVARWRAGLIDTGAVITDITGRLQILNAEKSASAVMDIAEQAKAAVGSSFKGAAGEMGVPAALAGWETANAEIDATIYSLRAANASQEEIDFTVAGIVDRWRDVNSQLGKTTTAVTQIDKAFEDLKSKVSSVLSGALNLSPTGVNSSDLLPREDAIQEDAFRLADVAVNGFASPWADYLNTKFPEMFGEAFQGGDIKTKAAQLLKDFEDGLNPQLIDKDKAKERVKRMILGEASMAELAAQVTAELQAEMGGNAPADLAAKVQSVIGGGGGTGGAAAGADFAGTTLDAVITSDVGGNLIATVVNQAAGKAALLKTSGASNGKLWGDAFLGTVRDGVPSELIMILVSLVLPEVIVKMAAAKSAAGTVD